MHMGLHVCLACLWWGASATAQVTTRTDQVGKWLNAWHAAGTAAGLAGITYENRDNGHSQLNAAEWPQLKIHAATEQEKAGQQHAGPASTVRPQPTIGNCSMSATADKGGSLPRLYLAQPQGFNFLASQYLNCNLFVYPEHQDYDPGWNGRGGYGDLYPANVPYLLVSQGSSFQDMPFVRALFSATAAMPPETQQSLVKGRLLIPTLQSLLRRSSRLVKTEADYFTGRAHPPVFDASVIDEEKLVQLAHAMNPTLVPPVALLEVIQESKAVNGRDYFEILEVAGEVLGDSPCAIARVFRSSALRHEMTVSAAKSFDGRRRPLEMKWVLLQGDPALVKIEPAPGGASAKISVGWHPELRAAGGIQTHRVDIGVFAHNGFAWSAPSFISIYMLPNEARFLDEKGRLAEICYENGNPDPGLPATSDLRWLTLGRRLDSDRNSLPIKLLVKGLLEESIVRLQAIANELSPQQEALRKLAEQGKKPEADAAQAKLQQDLQARLEAPTVGGRQSVVEAVAAGINLLAGAPDMYATLQDELQILARDTGRPDALANIAAARKRLVDWHVYLETDPGRVALPAEPPDLTEGQRHHLKQFHLTVLSEAVLPEFLSRSLAPAFVDTRLTTPKAWRDVYLYDKEGTPLGWTRYTNGRRYEFDTEGRLLPEGRRGRTVEVQYVKDATGAKLVFAPK